jgi:hypothetical protein
LRWQLLPINRDFAAAQDAIRTKIDLFETKLASPKSNTY